jgi:Cu/Ag efflux protein CusF
MRRTGWSAVAGFGIAGLLVAVPLARATDDSTKSSTSSSQPQGGTASGSSSGSMGSGASSAAPKQRHEVTGKIKKFDHASNTITLDQSDKKLKVGERTKVMKDGAKVSASDLHEGDQVRASYSETPTAGAFDILVIEVVPGGGKASSGASSGGSSGMGSGAAPGGASGGSTGKKPAQPAQ